MSGVLHVVDRAVADDPHTLGVLALAAAMADGKPCDVFVAHGARASERFDTLARAVARDSLTVLYHQRGSAPALVRRLVDRATRIAVVHEDGVPDPLAQRDLQLLAAAGATGLATGSAGASRLDDLGFSRVVRVPPVVARDRIVAVPAFAPTANHVAVALHGPLVLSVDDMATAANAARVVQAFHVLRTYLIRAGHLALAVAPAVDTSAAAVHAVQREMWGLRLTDAWAQRLTNPGERAAFTRGAAVFVTADPAAGDVRHALAAMAEGVPVVAPADASAAEVLGAGALLLPPGAGAALVAEAVAELLANESRRAQFAAAAHDTVARYAPERVAPAWRAALAA